MQILKIFADPALSPELKTLLADGLAPHEVIFPARPAGSVLEKAESDPRFAEADIAFGQPDPADVLTSPRLRWLHISTAGYTRYDTPEFRSAAAEKGLVFTNSSGVYADACAHHALGFLLAHARRLPDGFSSAAPNGSAEWNALRARSTTLAGKNIFIAGYGGIAKRLGELLAPFGAHVTATRRNPRGDEGMAVFPAGETDDALPAADHIIDILPDNAETRLFFDARRFSLMKPGAVFHNIGRGTTVDQQALHAALTSGRLDSAWLDVTDPEPLPGDHPLRSLANCFITPHTAGGHADEARTLVLHFLENFRRHVSSQPLLGRVM